MARQLECQSGNSLERGESGTRCVSAGRFVMPVCCREEPLLGDPQALDRVVCKNQHPRRKSLPPLPLFICCIFNIFLSVVPESSFPQATSSGCCGNEDKVANNERGPPTGQINPARSSVTQKAARLSFPPHLAFCKTRFSCSSRAGAQTRGLEHHAL